MASLQPSFHLKQLRLAGDYVRLLKAHPGRWQVHLMGRGGSSELLQVSGEKPSYQQVEALLKDRPEARINMTLMERLAEGLRDEWPL